jgi:hypothetical protein
MRCATPLRHHPGPVEIDVDHPFVIFGRVFEDGLAHGRAGIVEQHVDRHELALHPVDGAAARVGIGHVERDHERTAFGGADLLRQGFEPVHPAGGDRDLGAGLGEHPGRVVADAARGAGDENAAAGHVERIGHRWLLLPGRVSLGSGPPTGNLPQGDPVWLLPAGLPGRYDRGPSEEYPMAKSAAKASKKPKRFKSVLTGPVGTVEPRFLHDLDMDRMVGAFVALCSEVYVLRDRVATLEAVLEDGKVIGKNAIEDFVENAERAKARQEDAKRFVRRVLRELHRSDVPVSHIGRKAREMTA